MTCGFELFRSWQWWQWLVELTGKKKPVATCTTHPTGTGFWQVGKFQLYPYPWQPIPVTRTGCPIHYLHNHHNF